MTTIGILGAGELRSQLARAAIANGYKIVIANTRDPETVAGLIGELGSSARAPYAAAAAAAADFAVVAFPCRPVNDLQVDELASGSCRTRTTT